MARAVLRVHQDGTRANCRAAVDVRDEECPSPLHRSMEQQSEHQSSFSALISAPGVVTMLRIDHCALSTGCMYSPCSAPPTSSGRLNDRDKRAAPPCWTTDRP